jgi:hypothetical protein
MKVHGHATSALAHAFLILICVVALALVAPSTALAVEEGLQELRLPPFLVEKDVKPETDSELPPPTYPVERVEQLPVPLPEILSWIRD